MSIHSAGVNWNTTRLYAIRSQCLLIDLDQVKLTTTVNASNHVEILCNPCWCSTIP